jgi:fumarylacetoacetate (FAA) hydrolase
VKLATLKDGTRDGTLLVVSRDLAHAVPATGIASTLLDAIERWEATEHPLRALAERLEAADVDDVIRFDPADVCAPLPRTWQWLDGSVFENHGRLMAAALHPDKEHSYGEYPLVYQGAGDDFIGPCDDVVVPSEDDGIDFEGEIAVVVDAVPMGTRSAQAEPHIKLLLLVNDVSLRVPIRREIGTGFGFLNAKPSSAFSPVAVTLDELGDAWHDARVHLPLQVEWNGEWFGSPNCREMTFDFCRLIEHVTRSRRLSAGTVIGSGTVSNEDRSTGSACIAERRAVELLEEGAPKTPFMSFGDTVKIEMFHADGGSIFGAIEQRVVQHEPVPA